MTRLYTVTLLAAAAKSLQSCPTLCDPMDCSLPGSSIHGTFQARVLEWGTIAFSSNKYTHTYSHISIYCVLRTFSGEGNGTPLQYSCLESPMDRGAWWAAVHGVAKESRHD